MSALSARDRLDTVEELRRLLPRLEAGSAEMRVLPLGPSALDGHLPGGGLAAGALHEIAPQSDVDTPAAFGFIVALLVRMAEGGAIFFVASPRGLSDYGKPYGHGLNHLGLHPSRLTLVEAESESQALWAIEEAIKSHAPAAVAGALGKGLGLKASQRLQMAAGKAGFPLLLLRPAKAAASSAAATRWRIGAAGSARDRFGLIAGWRWRVSLERCRNGRPGEWFLEWDHAAYRFSLAAPLADPALSGGAGAEFRIANAGRS
jgi:protein ImuA